MPFDLGESGRSTTMYRTNICMLTQLMIDTPVKQNSGVCHSSDGLEATDSSSEQQSRELM